MTEPEESLATNEEEGRKSANEPILSEPKEESLGDIISALGEQKASNQSSDFLKEPKEEPPDCSLPAENEISHTSKVENDCKKEEMLEDEEILLSYGAIDKSDASSLSLVEPKLEVLEDRIIIAVENPDELEFFDDLTDEETEEPLMKKSQSQSRKKKTSQSSKSYATKRSNTEMKCPKCEFRTHSVNSWLYHLKSKYSMTPKKAGVALRCECGYVCGSETHSRECDTPNFTVIRKHWEPVRKLVEVSTKNRIKVKCAHCEAYSKTISSYVVHLRDQHQMTLVTSGHYLKCGCGLELRANFHSFYQRKHMEECASLPFTVHKREKEVASTPRCVLREAYPATAYAYAAHLHWRHKSTLDTNGIFLRCSCGLIVHSFRNDPNHNKECDGRKYTLHIQHSSLSTNEESSAPS